MEAVFDHSRSVLHFGVTVLSAWLVAAGTISLLRIGAATVTAVAPLAAIVAGALSILPGRSRATKFGGGCQDECRRRETWLKNPVHDVVSVAGCEPFRIVER